MPEEKKESFTFSDKIKNSKPTGAKSFAKSSSKVGRDGKPRQTLFERTRRDAPFFIAALVALLLLPFLYKYSGQSSEETLLSTPGSEDSMFDPERYGFDTAMSVEDPEGQIAQLSGRDSLDLIRGWGNKEEDFGRDDMDFNASASGEYEGEGEYSANRSSSTNIDEEENVTNIYKRRARAGTRAAFRRTQIGTLNPAAWRRPGGSRLGINHWGGSMKDAAKKVKGPGPRNAPKPVSLQPLRAAGPARSSFGGGAAKAARMGKDNMGKANAIEALRDSYVTPVGPTRTGGLDLFSDGRLGGGGKLNHNINIGKGQTPWWWDMMKTRMQEEWMARFKRKWDWINFFDKLAQNILKGLINCIITGDADGDPDHFLGDINIGGDSTGKKECCGMNQKKWEASHPGVAFNSDACKGWMTTQFGEKYKEKCPSGWVDKSSAGGASVGFFGQRLKCLGISASGYASGDLGLNSASGLNCEYMPNYTVVPSGQARKWDIYTYVVVRNYAPQVLVDAGKISAMNTKNGKQYLLCGSSDRKHGGTSLEHNDPTAGIGNVSAKNEKEIQNVIVTNKKSSNVSVEQQEIREKYLEYDQESLQDSCVIVVSRGNMLMYEQVKNQIMDLFMKKYDVSSDTAAKAFFQLDLMFVESFATKHKLAYAQLFETGHKLVNLLPMTYLEFENAYILHRKVTHKLDGSRDKVYKAKWRIEDVDMVKGPKCFYGLQIDCGPDNSAQAYVKFNQDSFKGGLTKENGQRVQPNPKDVHVSAEFRYLDNGQEGAKNSVVQPMTNIPGVSADGFTFTYTFSNIIDSDKVTHTKEIINPKTSLDNGKGNLVGNIIWKVTRGKEVVTRDCPLNMSGNGPSEIVYPKDCPKGLQSSQECCERENANDPDNTYTWTGNKCVITPKNECPQGRDTNQKCCEKEGGKWNKQTQKCEMEQPVPPLSDQYTIFAPGIKCVPNTTTDRKARPNGSMTEQEECKLFGAPLVGKYNTSGQSCKELWGFKMDSAKATAFVNRVKQAYNKQNPNLPIKFDKQYPQDSEFIDALNIAPTVGITDVPVAAVCEMGRDFVRMSKDKHVGNRAIIAGSTGTKDEQLVFRNELGAFLTYIHDTSILYPDAFVRVHGRSECDWRFQPYGMADGGCSRNLGPKIGKAYAHNNYNGTSVGNKYQVFVNSLTPIMKQTPLRALAVGKEIPHNCGNCKAMNGQNYVKEYNSYKGFAGLLHEETPSINGQGVACEAFLGGNKDATMKVEDALKYIEGICTAGLDYKPYGIGSTGFNPNQRPTTTGGPGGKDEITGRRM